jgi:NAD(P)-dependent dehydrogenase (short-subunit alcohol dehydrogenase family)
MKNKIVLIAGLGKLGVAITKYLIEKNYKVFCGEKNKLIIKKLKKNIKSENIDFFYGDLTKKKNIDKFLLACQRKFGNFSHAINCLYPPINKRNQRFEFLNEKDLKIDLYNQLGATIIFSQRIAKFFTKKNISGNLLLISSILGVSAPKFEHYFKTGMYCPIQYSASKAAIISIVRYLAKYYKNCRIRVNSISPGGIKNNQSQLFTKNYNKSCNSKGMLDPQDIVSAVGFLLLNESQFITGQNIIVDDGWSL